MKRRSKIILDNIKTILSGDYKKNDVDLNTLCNLALLRIDRKTGTPSLRGVPKLTREQVKQVKDFYRPYVKHMTVRYHQIYTHLSGGKFYKEYMPEEFFLMEVDRFFNDRQEAMFLDNKCYYYRLFPDLKQPPLIAMRVGKNWLGADLNLIEAGELKKRIMQEPEVVLKRAVNTEGGYGVEFLSGEMLASQFQDKLLKGTGDLVIQRPVRQHPLLAKLHPESVNTFRIVSLLMDNQVKICATSLKIGIGRNRMDNGGQGGMYCAVAEDGKLGAYGVIGTGERIYEHPDLKYRLKGQPLPSLEGAYELIQKAHPFMGHFRLIGWDIAIDEQGEAVMIEANLSMGGVFNQQICRGPVFGDDTRRVLDEVFEHKKRKFTTLM